IAARRCLLISLQRRHCESFTVFQRALPLTRFAFGGVWKFSISAVSQPIERVKSKKKFGRRASSLSVFRSFFVKRTSVFVLSPKERFSLTAKTENSASPSFSVRRWLVRIRE